MRVLYEWCKEHPPEISPPVYYRFITEDDEREWYSGEIESIILQSSYDKERWEHCEDWNSYTPVLNILHLIEQSKRVQENKRIHTQ